MDRIDQHLDDMYEDFFHMDFLYSEFAKRFGESYYSMSVLFLLGEHPDGISQKQLVDELLLPKQTVGSIVGGFEKKGLATHRPAESDKRSKLHALTPAGCERYETMLGALRTIERSCVRQIGEEDMARSHAVTKRYLELFHEQLDS